MVSDAIEENSFYYANRKNELRITSKDKYGNSMIGISYIANKETKVVKKNISELCEDKKYNDYFWEESLVSDDKMIIYAKLVSSDKTYEINTMEQLRELDDKSSDLNSNIILLIAKELDVSADDIKDITILKKGMTNRSFKFKCNDKYYIMRIPGEGTDKVINRKNECEVYKVLEDLDITDEVIYINPENGYKLTYFWEDARVCDPYNFYEVKKCMEKLRYLHEFKIEVDHTFDLFKQIEYYEELRESNDSMYKDYKETKNKIYELKEYIESVPKEMSMSHIDSVPDNFLIINDEIRLIDWEYSAMQDPHLDIAMFAIYSLYEKSDVDKLISFYFDNGCDHSVRIKIYSYIAISGLLWSNWCEYKSMLGVEFGEYSLKQYRYAKDYYKIARREMLVSEEV
jgi:thiamine kinase-like enzyme